MSLWYYTQNGQQLGPVDEAQLQGLLASGQVGTSDLVWKEGMAAWQPAAAIPELSGASPLPAQPAPAQGYIAPPQPSQPQTFGQGQTYGQPQPYVPQYGSPMAACGAPDQFGKALAAFILSIAGAVSSFGGLCCVVIPAVSAAAGIVAIILSVMALKGMKLSGNLRGKGLATAALIIAGIAVLLSIIMVVMSIVGMAYMANQRQI